MPRLKCRHNSGAKLIPEQIVCQRLGKLQNAKKYVTTWMRSERNMASSKAKKLQPLATYDNMQRDSCVRNLTTNRPGLCT